MLGSIFKKDTLTEVTLTYKVIYTLLKKLK